MLRNRFIIGGAVIALALLLWIGHECWWANPKAGEPITIPVATTDTKNLARLLDDVGIIDSPHLFRLYVRLDGRRYRLKTGNFLLRRGMSFNDVLSELTAVDARKEVQVRVIEGWTIRQIGDAIEAVGGNKDLFFRSAGKAANEAPFSSTWREKFTFLQNLPKNRSLEGYLFPDTYRLWQDELPNSLIEKQLEVFEERVGKRVVGPESAPLKTLDEAIILASIVEKEVRSDADRRRVAGVFLTRLREGMMLQSDATIQYVTGSGRARSNAQDLALNSPFNTYKVKGLPPAPIGQPSLSSILAVLSPDVRGERYFLTDDAGTVYYARTFEQHKTNRVKAGY